MSAKEKILLALCVTAFTESLKLFLNEVLPLLVRWLVGH